MSEYKRTLNMLREHAVLHWPQEIRTLASKHDVLPLLLKTQDQFISILKSATKSPDSWVTVLNHCKEITPSVFLKHLMLLSDIGGEALNKLPPVSTYFENNKMEYSWDGSDYTYEFKEIAEKCSLTNNALRVDAKKIKSNTILTDKMCDVAYILIYGSQSTNTTLPPEIVERCVIGGLMLDPKKLDEFCKQHYIRVSRQISGATSNSLGQVTQDYVIDRLRTLLDESWEIKKDGVLPNVSHHSNGKGTNFDIIVKSQSGNYAGIEVSFQVTTNSVIERKARESRNILVSAHAAKHKVCYIIDGAGNINIRKTAVETICSNSDCTVALSDSEIKKLSEFLRQELI